MKSDKQDEFDFDALQHKLGGFSYYQMLVVLLVSAFTFGTGPASQMAVFISATPEFRLAYIKKSIVVNKLHLYVVKCSTVCFVIKDYTYFNRCSIKFLTCSCFNRFSIIL